MKYALTAILLLPLALTSCSNGVTATGPSPSGTSAAVATPSASIPQAPLQGAITVAQADHASADEAVAAMDALSDAANQEIFPNVVRPIYIELETKERGVYEGIERGATERETVLAVQEYAAAVEKTAVRFKILD